MKTLYNSFLILLTWVTNLTIYFLMTGATKIIIQYSMEKNQYTTLVGYLMYLGIGIISYYPMRFVIEEFKKLKR